MTNQIDQEALARAIEIARKKIRNGRRSLISGWPRAATGSTWRRAPRSGAR